jgi:hypothetical protein
MNSTERIGDPGAEWRAVARWPAAALLAIALMLVAARTRAQDLTGTSPLWEPWLGCWQPVSGPARLPGDTTQVPLVCVTPSPASAGVDVVTVSGGRIATRSLVEATGERRPVTPEGCSGWERAQFSSDGARVYLMGDYTCPGNLERTTSELMAITVTGEWLDVRGATVRGVPAGVHVLRYRVAARGADVPSDLAWAVDGRGGPAVAIQTARLAAAPRVTPADVVEASHVLDPVVVEAWLTEVGQGFDLDGRQLVALQHEGVPGRVIDVMVALSYPDVFTLGLANQGPRLRPSRGQPASGDDGYGRLPVYGWGYGTYGCYSPLSWDCNPSLGWGYYSRFYSPYYSPYGYGFGYYPAGGVVVVSGGSSGRTTPHGRMVIGRGYTQGGAPGGAPTGTAARPRGRSGPPAGSPGGRSAPAPSSGGRRAASPASGSSARSTGAGTPTGRTAHRKP